MENKPKKGCSINMLYLTIIFILLKVTGVINWSWLWVLSPLWIYYLLLVLCLVWVFGLVGLVLLFPFCLFLKL